MMRSDPSASSLGGRRPLRAALEKRGGRGGVEIVDDQPAAIAQQGPGELRAQVPQADEADDHAVRLTNSPTMDGSKARREKILRTRGSKCASGCVG